LLTLLIMAVVYGNKYQNFSVKKDSTITVLAS
jgi:hypothetical protein